MADLGELHAAESLDRRALAIREELLGPEHPDVAFSLNNLGYLKWELGNYEAARPLMERAIAIKEKVYGAEHPGVGASLLNLGILLITLGEQDRAEETLLRAISLCERASHWCLSYALCNYAILLQDRGDLISARQYNQRALEILERTEGTESDRFARTLNILGDINVELGEFEEARACLQRSLTIRERLGADHAGVVDPLESLAALSARMGNLDEATQLAKRALAIKEQSLGKDHPDVASSLETLGKILRQSEDYAQARVAFERALEIREKTLGSDSPAVNLSLVLLADLNVDTGNCAEALPVYRKAVTVTESLHGPDHPEVEDCTRKIAACLARTGLNAEAFENAFRAEEISRGHLRLTLTGLAERVGLQYAASRESGLDLAFSLLIDDPASGSAERGFDALIRSRALVLDEMAERRRWVSVGADSDVERLAEQLAGARNRLAFLTVQGPADPEHLETYRRLLKQARADRDRAEQELADRSRTFRLQQERRRTGLIEIKAALPVDSGLVGFARFERLVFDRSGGGGTAPFQRVPSYLAFVLTRRKGGPNLVSLGSAEEIEGLVQRLQDQIFQQAEAPGWGDKSAESTYRQESELLRRRIWDPIKPYLTDVERLFVVPDGALHLVNLAALPVGVAGYLIEQGPQIHYLSAERDLVAGSSVSTGEGFLALGNPDFNEPKLFAALAPEGEAPVAGTAAGAGDTAGTVYRGRRSACERLQALTFEELNASGKEVHEVITLWRKGKKTRQQATPESVRQSVAHLSRGKASETAFKSMAPGRQNLHVATHGFFLGGRCPSAAEGESPLLLTGLAMAGANHRQAAGPDEDDGILTAEEIAALDLNGVEWAVLSACETGLGEVRAGEGVLGLRRAFSVAGARTLIMSLWRVEDEPTRDWMKVIYERRYVDGLGTAEAVHQASLELLQRRRQAGLSTHPFYWAGFVAAGDWR
jgi:CHAT domain-containing protein/tetratricopeptide (TPR) repeat protein